jgi:predicted transcriptional regulator
VKVYTIADFVLRLLEVCPARPCEIFAKISHKQRESISSTLSAMKKQGFITKNKTHYMITEKGLLKLKRDIL